MYEATGREVEPYVVGAPRNARWASIFRGFARVEFTKPEARVFPQRAARSGESSENFRPQDAVRVVPGQHTDMPQRNAGPQAGTNTQVKNAAGGLIFKRLFEPNLALTALPKLLNHRFPRPRSECFPRKNNLHGAELPSIQRG